ncbi:MAG: dinitrogenase iron-molybdenum cofactor biosynthesis protein [Deltaproteobacteria bacterium]|jgi:predicted Fe-Mo cluster-binding NifX family protein|nr:dinitrogenase iron-molybdenum cofactor biosynthesis protein [Deltaproteobacteria bacterium]MDX9761299.1 dinitrogenase iron-molybdenum cofactor biosynthesis protein [Desulfomonilia bacterium]
MRIAIAHCQDKLSPVFDFSNSLCLIDIDCGRETNRERRALVSREPFRRAGEVLALGVDILICGALSRQMETALAAAGVRTVGFICGNLDDVVAAFLQGSLEDGRLLMPGCVAGRKRRRRRNRRGRN